MRRLWPCMSKGFGPRGLHAKMRPNFGHWVEEIAVNEEHLDNNRKRHMIFFFQDNEHTHPTIKSQTCGLEDRIAFSPQIQFQASLRTYKTEKKTKVKRI